ATPEIGVLSTIPDVAPEQQLGRELGGEGDPAAECAHHPLLGVAIVADATGRRLDGEGAGQGGIAHDGRSVDRGALRAAGELVDLLVGEAGQSARFLGDRDADLLVRAVQTDAAEVEALVDRLLERDGLLSPVGIALGELVEPARAHAHVGDLVGQHEIDGALDDGITDLARDVNQLVEDVAGQAFEATIDAGHAGRRVFGTGAPPEDRGLRELAHVTAQVLEQAQVDLDVARLVPDLTGHVQGELPRRVGKVADGTAGPLHRLQLTDEDAVDALANGFPAGQIGHRREALRHAQLRDVAGALAYEALLTRELVVGDGPFHAASLYGVGCSWRASAPGARWRQRGRHDGVFAEATGQRVSRARQAFAPHRRRVEQRELAGGLGLEGRRGQPDQPDRLRDALPPPHRCPPPP